MDVTRKNNPLPLDSATLQQQLTQIPVYSQIKTWWLAYSGGVDSRVLLHLLAPLKLNLSVVYIDHGLQKESAGWAQYCAQICEQYGLPFQSVAVQVNRKHHQGLEAAAREARYQALAALMDKGDALLTAQHSDDQAETFLLQLFRGAGAAGLASMPLFNAFASGWQIRPLLHFGQQQIMQVAEQHQLQWIEDPSNQNEAFDRNFLRHQITPRLSQRWPNFNQTLVIAAQQQAENNQLLSDLAELDMQDCMMANGALSLPALKKLSEARQRNGLRHWIYKAGFKRPSRKILQQILQQVLTSKEDAKVQVCWSDVCVRRYQNAIYVLPRLQHARDQELEWLPEKPVFIESLQKKLQAVKLDKEGIMAELLLQPLQVKFRQGGERIKLVGRQHSQSLKHLFQEAGIPPWERDCIPFIYYQNQLVAVGEWVADGFSADNGWLPVLSDKKT